MTDWREHIVHDPKVCGGQATARGTRIMATVILDDLASGMTEVELFKAYPTLTSAHVLGALGYAAALAHKRQRLDIANSIRAERAVKAKAEGVGR